MKEFVGRVSFENIGTALAALFAIGHDLPIFEKLQEVVQGVDLDKITIDEATKFCQYALVRLVLEKSGESLTIHKPIMLGGMDYVIAYQFRDTMVSICQSDKKHPGENWWLQVFVENKAYSEPAQTAIKQLKWAAGVGATLPQIALWALT